MMTFSTAESRRGRTGRTGAANHQTRQRADTRHRRATRHSFIPLQLVGTRLRVLSLLQHIHVVLGAVQQGVALIMSHIFKRTSPCRLIIPELGEIQCVCWGSRSSAGQQRLEAAESLFSSSAAAVICRGITSLLCNNVNVKVLSLINRLVVWFIKCQKLVIGTS